MKKEISKSQKMIQMYNEGKEIKEISTKMNVRYNFVYNVISNYCRMNDVELRTNRNNEDSKKSKIVELLQKGLTKTEVSKELKCNYNYVFKVEKEMKITKEFDIFEKFERYDESRIFHFTVNLSWRTSVEK